MPSDSPATTATPADFLSCTDIAAQIASERGGCCRSSVWRAIQRLAIRPALTVGKYNFYTAADAKTISAEMRRLPSGKIIKGEA